MEAIEVRKNVHEQEYEIYSGIGSEDMTPRHEKALKILENKDAVKEVDDKVYTVESQTGYGLYRVEDTGEWKCNCPDYITRGSQCKHVLAVRYYLEIQGDTVSGLVSERVPLTNKQAWSAYNQAQIQEIELFDKLLKELCNTIPETEQHMGRPKLSLPDQVFCAVQKAYSQLSSRRAHTLFRRAEDNGQLSHAPHFNQVSKTLLRRGTTHVLQELIRLSALPLASLETDFAIDSSGFRCSTFGSYCSSKHGTKRQHNWIKAHICSGVKTNIVTDATITKGNANDSPHFEGLVRNTADGFAINEISADKAYSSRANLETVNDVGATPYIPFRKNTRARACGSSMWKKMFHYFQLYREDFDEHYHKRSNVETTFGAIKAKFGETLKSKKWVAQANELLCKILAYNITVLIHEMFESGITQEFLTLKSEAQP